MDGIHAAVDTRTASQPTLADDRDRPTACRWPNCWRTTGLMLVERADLEHGPIALCRDHRRLFNLGGIA